ncbi:ABC transporter ATP-binding protein [Streptomyces sp. NBC_01077]|uniref:ABC transporter ATP-binding protein n=1 Tax=Streptomyces sp. NBC_01077 TaxID=2903746 RepID=UPI0038667E6F|nr:ABC transporter ATP-binding protein [Streptomyces sp. NBC_01077]WSV43648.1 ABC transporter ATP-binding protein [Streptomyces sp. NBC_01077]
MSDHLMMPQAAILMTNVTKCYRGPQGDITAVDNVNLGVLPGEIFGLLGPNGAGKTTSIEIMMGLRAPSSGTVRILGIDPSRERDKLRSCAAIQPQQAALFENQTVAELLRTWASLYPEPDSVDSVISRMGLQGARDVRVSKLSGGQRQRLLVGTALISRPKVLVLDEPSTGLDPNARQELWDAIRMHADSGGTTLLSTHSMEEAEMLCDRVAILFQGRVVACGDPHTLMRNHAPEQELHFTVSPDTDLTFLKDHSAVSHLVAHESDTGIQVRLRTMDSDSVLGILTGPVAARKIQIREASLDAVFRKLTGRAFAEADHTESAERTRKAKL